MSHLIEFQEKMRRDGQTEAAIRAFTHNYTLLEKHHTGLIPEDTILPADNLPHLDQLSQALTPAGPQLLAQTAILKLNGGLGTGMGLETAKSLLPVRDGLTFLDLIARQILSLRTETGAPVSFLLMNSFSTSADTAAALRAYPQLGDPATLEIMQSRVPKVDAATLAPLRWPADPDLEWCPPGHGDLYPSLLGSGKLDSLLASGARYLFVSNSDNLGATLDPHILRHFAHSRAPFLMEVTPRTAADRKGGHLARDRRTGALLLRESAQCPETDLHAFQDIARHRYFNTNNLWLRLDTLRDLLAAHGGLLPLPLIRNQKTADPRSKTSPPVLQLETAMGAAISSFPGASALVVPRTRFAPVKTTSDLLLLRSDAYEIAPGPRLQLHPDLNGHPPEIDLDPAHYKMTDQLDAATAHAIPSLRHCRALRVRGPVTFPPGVILRGDITITNPAPTPLPVPPGLHENTEIRL